MSQEFFYHSFPRVNKKLGEGAEQNNNRAIQIFKNIIRNGLLITPEVLNLPFELEDWQNPVVQHRCCFTLLERENLKSHTERFGEFSIEWNTQALKRLGILPVVYLPLFAFEDENHMENVGAKFLYRMLRYHEFSRRCFRNSEAEYAKSIVQNNYAEASIYKEEMELFTDMKGWFEGLQNMIYPIDHKKYNTGENGYYHQREWKLPGNLIFNGKWITTSATKEQQEDLLALNKDFFEKRIVYTGKEVKRAEISLYLKEFENKHILEHANKVIVPSEFIAEIKSYLNEFNINLTVEEL